MWQLGPTKRHGVPRLPNAILKAKRIPYATTKIGHFSNDRRTALLQGSFVGHHLACKSSEVRFSLNKMYQISLCGNSAVWGTLPYRVHLVFLGSEDKAGCKTEILFVLKWYESCVQGLVRDDLYNFNLHFLQKTHYK